MKQTKHPLDTIQQGCLNFNETLFISMAIFLDDECQQRIAIRVNLKIGMQICIYTMELNIETSQ